MEKMYDVIIVGGGLAGLTSAICLAKKSLKILLVEKKTYPFHRVCGEYISCEVLPFLKSINIDPYGLGAKNINKFMLTSPSGKSKLEVPLRMGGFGISRYLFDEYFFKSALALGAEILTGETVEDIIFENNQFLVSVSGGKTFASKLVIGAYGKRALLDKKLKREFMQLRSPYMGVKYHIKTDFPQDKIALHNFKNGYCGLSAIEGDLFNLCYLTDRKNLKIYGSIDEMEENILLKNPFIKYIKANADFLFEKPLVINEISFMPKAVIENHVLMCGDTAGLITPLCGNGMAMAIRSAHILSENIHLYFTKKWSREQLENNYQQQWQINFKHRLWAGRNLQKLFGNKIVSELAIGFLKDRKKIIEKLIEATHGEEF